MRILIDENLPKKLKLDFKEHEIFTVRDKGWNSKKNGELLSLMVENGFNVLITFDKNLEHQQNFSIFPITLIVLIAENNTYEMISPLISKVKIFLSNPALKGIVRIEK